MLGDEMWLLVGNGIVFQTVSMISLEKDSVNNQK